MIAESDKNITVALTAETYHKDTDKLREIGILYHLRIVKSKAVPQSQESLIASHSVEFKVCIETFCKSLGEQK